MRQYQQLTEDDRIEIYAMKQAGKPQRTIAQRLAVHPSTVSRELARNTGQRGYRPKQAHCRAQQRRQYARKAVKMTPQTIAYIESQIRQEHSPEQIAGHKKKRKRYGKHDFRGKIPNRVGIEQRPQIVAAKKRIGDWEADTIIGKYHRGAVISAVERKSQFTLLGQVRHKTAAAVQQQIVQRLHPQRRRIHTITTDNGREFADHKTIADKLQAKFYFAQPYQAWQRGLNEQVNGLIRQYLPKQTDLRYVTDDQLRFIMDRLNHRPRKTLGFKTPYEVFCNSSRFKTTRVALGS